MEGGVLLRSRRTIFYRRDDKAVVSGELVLQKNPAAVVAAADQRRNMARRRRSTPRRTRRSRIKALRTWHRCCWTWDLGLLLLDLGTGIAAALCLLGTPGSGIAAGNKDQGSLLEARTWERLGPGRMEEKQGQGGGLVNGRAMASRMEEDDGDTDSN
uniref:Uncharacterized protein n=1 Tax=Aegilops tauschii TaxID=37682 RepID=N1R091_AEGTA